MRFAVRLTPRGGRDAIDGWATAADGSRHLKVRVSVPPEDGKANAALIVLLAKFFAVSKSSVTIVGGATARQKLVEVAGENAALTARLNDV
ncbi:MAG: DUF167 domain-containing protein [Proteobacteria bacterium]|nr:DUF167 domain-containing protein [Pseudomonadota bacterium]